MSTTLLLGGFAAFLIGVGLVFVPAAVVLGGLGAMYAGAVLARDPDGGDA